MRRIVGALVCVGMLCLVALVAANCYSPPNPTCGFQCSASNSFACPTDYTCSKVDQVCRLDSAAAGESCQSDAHVDSPAADASHIPPMLVSTVPANNATDVDRNTPITLTFDQHVNNVKLTTALVMDGTTQLAGTYMDGGNNQWTFTSALPGGHVITVNLTSQIVSDTGTPLPATSFSFTTHDDEPPMLVSSDPLDMGTAASTASPITLVFNEAVTAVDTTTVVVTCGGAPCQPTVFTASSDAKTWTLTGATLVAASTITVALGTGIVDLAGNHLAATAFSFTTP